MFSIRLFITYSSPRYLSMLTNFTQRTKIFEAASISSTDGKDGAIRILLSFGSLPYGYVAPAPVRTTPASLHIATIFFAQPSNASNEMKYPIKALIEALKNIILHRDYSYKGDSIIRIYKDRIEFISLGELIGNLTMEGIELGISVLRNLNLMRVFQEIGITKGNGEGIQEILSAYKEYKVKPVFKSIGGVFQVILPKPEYTVNGKVISDKYRRVLEFMEKRGTANNKEIQEHLELKSTSVVNYLKEMLELELIEKIRDGRNISYKIKTSK